MPDRHKDRRIFDVVTVRPADQFIWAGILLVAVGSISYYAWSSYQTDQAMLLDLQPARARELARPNIIKAVQAASGGAAEVRQVMKGPDGMHLVLIADRTTLQEHVMLASPKGHVIMDGFTWGNEAEDIVAPFLISSSDQSPYTPPPSFSGSITEAEYQRVLELPHLQQGDGRREAVVFYDPAGAESMQLPRVIAPYVRQGDLRIRWIPVSVVGGQTSLRLAALMLADGSPYAIADAFTGQLADKTPDEHHIEQVRRANAVLGDIIGQDPAAPVIVGRSAYGISYVAHLPSNLDAFVRNLVRD